MHTQRDESGRPAGFFTFTATRPVAISMVTLAVVVFGLVGLQRLPVNLLPDISYPSLTIRTQYPGASPEDVEERVSERLQESVAVVPGVRRVVSVSRPEVSDVVLQFAWGSSMIAALSDVRERIDRVELPRDAEQPLVLRYDPSLDPVMTIGLTSDTLSPADLRRLAEDEVERELVKVDGVAAVKIRGGDEEEIRVILDEQAITLLGFDVQTISDRLAAENVNTASGQIDEGNTAYLVRTLGEFANLEEIADLVIARREGAAIRVRDVARVERIPQEPEVISRIDGRPCVLVDLFKEAGANIVALAANVRRATLGTAAQQSYVRTIRDNPTKDPTSPSYVAPKEVEPQDVETPSSGRRPRRFGAEAAADTPRGKALAKHRRQTDFLEFRLERLGARPELLQDQSTFIETAISEVTDSAFVGGLFAIAVILLFLRNVRTTLILAVSIPLSLAASFAPMLLSGVSLNVMSLGGLALGVGMLVDSSIVVLEAITREREQGAGIAQAAVRGVGQVASAVTASTLTTVAVFFPIVFVEGVAGQLFRDQALTVVYSLSMALLVALFVIPMLASRGDDTSTPAATSHRERPLTGTIGRWAALGLGWPAYALSLRWLARKPKPDTARSPDSSAVWRSLGSAYPRLLSGALRARLLIVTAAIGLSVYAGSRVGALGSELVPQVAQRDLYVEVFLPRDATVERTDTIVAPLEREIAALDDVARTFLAVGVDKEELNDSEEGEHSARILVTLTERPNEDLAAQEERVRSAVRSMLRQRPEVQSYRFSRPSVLDFNAPLIVEVLGEDLVTLRRVSAHVRDRVAEIEGLRDVRNTLQRGNPELAIQLDRDKMSALGIDSGVVSRVLANKVQGDVPTRFAEPDRKIDLRVGLPREELATVARLREVNVNPAGSPAIPLGSIATITRREGPSEIRRLGNSRGAEIQAAVAGFDIGSMQDEVERTLAAIPRPRGIEVRVGGQKEEMQRSLDSLQLALLLAVFLVYIVMASQFESLVQPLIILATLPLAFVGVVLVLDVLAIPISVIALLGGIVLAGIVVNNAIILIDQINRLRLDGVPSREAIVRGAHSRLRPVMMTTLTTVLGLLPLTGWLQGIPWLGGTGEGLELRAPLAIVVVAGLTTSTLLTLLVIPIVYSFTVPLPTANHSIVPTSSSAQASTSPSRA